MIKKLAIILITIFTIKLNGQIQVIPEGESAFIQATKIERSGNIEYAEKINATLIDKGFRSSVDKRNEKISKKVRDAELKKIPYMLIVGDKEMESNSVSVRKKTEGDIGQKVVKDFIVGIQEELSNATN